MNVYDQIDKIRRAINEGENYHNPYHFIQARRELATLEAELRDRELQTNFNGAGGPNGSSDPAEMPGDGLPERRLVSDAGSAA